MTHKKDTMTKSTADIIVCKFGGSSVADAVHLQKVRSILESNPGRRVVVVSAPGKRFKDDEKVTDMLYACNKMVQDGQSCRPLFDKVAQRYLSIMDELGMKDTETFQQTLDDVRQYIDAGHGADYAASRGEYLSARLVSEYLGWTFIDTASMIIINHDGTVNPQTWTRLENAVDTHKGCYVVPGFYGATADGVVKTFSRGGSDITGSIMARAVNAVRYENWTDVSGVYMADPRMIADAKVVNTMTYREVRELAEVGAGVFHEEAIIPVMSVGIPINVKNTNDPEAPGTMIVPQRDASEHPLVGISGKKGYTKLSVHKMLLFKRVGIRQALLTMLHVFGIRPSFSLFGIDSVVWYFESSQASDSVLDALKTRLMSEFELDDAEYEVGFSIIGIVGEGLMQVPDLLGKANNALEHDGINVEFLNYGGSSTTCIFGVKSAQQDAMVKSLYRALVG